MKYYNIKKLFTIEKVEKVEKSIAKMELVEYNVEKGHKKGDENKLSDKEKQVSDALAAAMPNLSEFDKGYILGLTESAIKKSNKDSSEKETE